MNETMKAIVLLNGDLAVQNVEKPHHAEAGHLLIKMSCAAINSGDNFFLKNPTPPGMPKSLYGIKGVSGVGVVLQTGDGVPAAYHGKKVTVYRSLKFSEHVVGTWSEYAHVPFLDCVILPDNADAEEYAGSLVNIITPYGFYKRIVKEGHKGIISTAGNSATGIALLGICTANNFPLISIVRNDNSRAELEKLGAKNIVVQTDADFNQKLTDIAGSLSTTAIFDGVGGEILNKIIPTLPYGSTIYLYGFIGGTTPLTVHTTVLSQKKIIITSFSNTQTETVQNDEELEKALLDISTFIYQPHFKTKPGKKFSFEQVEDAILFKVENGKKAILYSKL